MAANERPLEEQLWANIGFIRRRTDREHANDLLRARRDFLRLRRGHELSLRQVYATAADGVAGQLRAMKPGRYLARNHLVALEKTLRREADRIAQATHRLMRAGLSEAVSLGASPLDAHLLRAIRSADVPLDILRLQRGFGRVNTAAVEALWARTHQRLRISDRIWEQSARARESIRDIIQAGLATGRDAAAVARDLERYVRVGARTLSQDYPNMMARMGEKRIPKDLVYEALRLVRTEYTRAFTEGVYGRGRVNPSYLGAQWMLSDAHPEPDVCDTFAEADLYDLGAGIYPKGEEPINPHPNCLCSVIPVVQSTDEFVRNLRGWVEEPRSQPRIEEWYTDVYRPMTT